MSMDLIGGSDGDRIDFTCRLSAWVEILRLAKFAGWEPAGTERPYWLRGDVPDEALNACYDGWDGGYLSNDGQFVTATDATALADALERALPDIERLEQAVAAVHAAAHRENWPRGLADALKQLAGPGRAGVSEIIRLCRAGGFWIT